MSGLHDLLACPDCRSGLAWAAVEARCGGCGHVFPIEDGIPVLLADAGDEQKRRQAAWFDDEADPEWEIERPFGAPAFHRFLLEEKFRRGTTGLAGLLPGATALVVCGGSGMDAQFLARAGARVITSDLSLGAARRARERAERFDFELFPIVADAEALPFRDRAADLVSVHDGLHHLERPLAGLAEMCRVAGRAVAVTEPARAALTALAVRARLAEDREESGNRVARLSPSEVAAEIERAGLRVVRAERYAMLYRHRPGLPSRVLSLPPLLPLARTGWRAANAVAGRFGNKLTVQGLR